MQNIYSPLSNPARFSKIIFLTKKIFVFKVEKKTQMFSLAGNIVDTSGAPYSVLQWDTNPPV